MRDGDLPQAPPHNDDAEMALLGALLHSNAMYQKVADFLRPEHFASCVHERIYKAIGRLVERGQVADPITLRQAFVNDPDLQGEGDVGAKYLIGLTRNVTSVVNAKDYAHAIVDLYQRRALIEACDAIMRDAYTDDLDRDGARQIEDAVERLSGLESGARRVEEAVPVLDTAAAAVLHAWDLHHGRVEPNRGMPWGLRELEAIVPGAQPGDLIIIAGRPGMGKTSLATELAARAAETAAALFISLEMPSRDLTQRMLASRSWVPVKRQNLGPLSTADCQRLDQARDDLARLRLYILDRPAQTMAQIRAAARRVKATRGGLSMVVIDHLGLIGVERGSRDGNRTNEISAITAACKALAKELSAPVVLLSQLNRAVEGRDDKRPTLADLRDSGSIEQDADIVLFPFREEYYLAREEPQQKATESFDAFSKRHTDWAALRSKSKGRAEIIVAKHRQGECGTAHVGWDGGRTLFHDLDAQ